MRPAFIEQLQNAWTRSNSFLCVGLDPTPNRFPESLSRDEHGVYQFCAEIIDATQSYVCAFKPQFAHFAALGFENVLAEVVDYIHDKYPHVPVILDAKRGDVGSTAERYAEEAFVRYNADAVTVNPYLGWDSVVPFTEHAGRGVILICRTSNADGGWLQEYPVDDPAYLRVARLAAEKDKGNLMLVLGATFPDLIGMVRQEVPSMPFLIPGVGTQGGDLDRVLDQGRSIDNTGLVINASRSVIHASDDDDDDFGAAAEAAARDLASKMEIISKR
ncbi:MAG: orotidine-5'-phosphate decarboxylase [Pseudomonadales bacterium]